MIKKFDKQVFLKKKKKGKTPVEILMSLWQVIIKYHWYFIQNWKPSQNRIEKQQ